MDACLVTMLARVPLRKHCIKLLRTTCRGNYEGPEPQRLATLKYAALSGAPYVDVEYKAAHLFFAGVSPFDAYVNSVCMCYAC